MQSAGTISPVNGTPVGVPLRSLDRDARLTRFRTPFIWFAVFALACWLDRAVAVAVHDTGIAAAVKNSSHLAHLVKAPGYFGFTVAIAGLTGLLHPRRWGAATFVALCGIAAGLNTFPKWLVGRPRPWVGRIGPNSPLDFHPMQQGLYGLFHQPENLSFPSGHTTLAFATATALYLVLRSTRAACLATILYAAAILVAVERISENAHWTSDVVAGAAMGIGCALAVRHFFFDLLLGSDSTSRHTSTQPPLCE